MFYFFSFNTYRIGVLWHRVFFTLCLWFWARRFGGYFEKIIASRSVFCNGSAHRRGLFSINVLCSFLAVKFTCSNHIKFRLKNNCIQSRASTKRPQNSSKYSSSPFDSDKYQSHDERVVRIVFTWTPFSYFLAITSSTDVMFFEHRSLRVGSKNSDTILRSINFSVRYCFVILAYK